MIHAAEAWSLALLAVAPMILSACGAPAAVPGGALEVSAEPAPPPAPDDALGGRLFDRWYQGKDFAPDDAKTPHIDGRGGPFGNGALPRLDRAPWANDGGHDYRLKNLFGWDLRGSEGISGPRYQNKKYVLQRNLLAGKEPLDALIDLLDRGGADMPAYGGVLSPDELRALAAFILGVRDGKLPHPDGIWALSESAPGHYALRPGGDPARGARIVRERCAGCHGEDGTKLLFDDGAHSLGSHARQKAYEDWLKILNGQPGVEMGRQVRGADGREMAEEILDILAALCDRAAFPRGAASAEDVPDGDPRCGPYLR